MVIGSNVFYKTRSGQKVTVKLRFEREQGMHGAYAQSETYHLNAKMYVRSFLVPQNVFAQKYRLGEDLWVSGGGSRTEGPQNFHECVQEGKVFDYMSDDDQLKSFLKQSLSDTARAINEFQNANQLAQNALRNRGVGGSR